MTLSTAEYQKRVDTFEAQISSLQTAIETSTSPDFIFESIRQIRSMQNEIQVLHLEQNEVGETKQIPAIHGRWLMQWKTPESDLGRSSDWGTPYSHDDTESSGRAQNYTNFMESTLLSMNMHRMTGDDATNWQLIGKDGHPIGFRSLNETAKDIMDGGTNNSKSLRIDNNYDIDYDEIAFQLGFEPKLLKHWGNFFSGFQSSDVAFIGNNSDMDTYSFNDLMFTFITNTTDEDIVVDTGLYGHAFSSYTSLSLMTFEPDVTNDERENIRSIWPREWYSYSSNNNSGDSFVDVTFPANKTVILMFSSSAKVLEDGNNAGALSGMLAYVDDFKNHPGLQADTTAINNAMSGKINRLEQIWALDGVQ